MTCDVEEPTRDLIANKQKQKQANLRLRLLSTSTMSLFDVRKQVFRHFSLSLALDKPK